MVGTSLGKCGERMETYAYQELTSHSPSIGMKFASPDFRISGKQRYPGNNPHTSSNQTLTSFDIEPLGGRRSKSLE